MKGHKKAVILVSSFLSLEITTYDLQSSAE